MKRLFFLIGVLAFLTVAYAQNSQTTDAPSPSKEVPEFKAEFPKEVISETKHTISLNGKSISYTATAGNLVIKAENGKPKASMFFVSYIKDGTQDYGTRPILFSFNGGPGSSSVWLHLGLLGPKRVVIDDQGNPLPPPYRLADNPESVLDQTDLVFIDPVTTGYSRPVPGEDPNQFHGVREDVQSVGEFIRLYLTRFKRWSSPKFLIGESYGTTRAAGLSGYLQEEDGIYLNGIILVSTVLDFQTLSFDVGNDLPYLLYLPSYTATAWYHKKLSADLQQGTLKDAVAAAEAFVEKEYAAFLLKGDRVTVDERTDMIHKMARLTGLSEEYLDQSNLRVPDYHFFKELRRSDRLTVGRLDSRFTGRDANAAGSEADYDPSYAAIQGVFTATLNNYLRTELKYESDLPYEILTGRVEPWNFGSENQYVNVAETLRQAMNENPDLHVFVACGYYDIATPFYAAMYTMNHLGLEPGLRDHLRMGFYEAGHMMYIHKPSLIQLHADIARFINDSLPH